MYRYDEFDQAFVTERVAQFRDQVARRLSGALSEDQFKPLRLQNGLYLQLHAYMLRVAVPYLGDHLLAARIAAAGDGGGLQRLRQAKACKRGGCDNQWRWRCWRRRRCGEYQAARKPHVGNLDDADIDARDFDPAEAGSGFAYLRLGAGRRANLNSSARPILRCYAVAYTATGALLQFPL